MNAKKILMPVLFAMWTVTGCLAQGSSYSFENMKGVLAWWDFTDKKPFRSKGPLKLTLSEGGAQPVEIIDGGPLSGRSIRLDGTNYLTLPYARTDRLDIKHNEVTVAAWVKWSREQTGFVAGMWNEYEDGGKRQYGLFISLPYYGGANQVCGHISRDGGPTPPFPYSIDYSASAQEVPENQWCLVAMTYDGVYIRSWFNGEFEARPLEITDHTTGVEGYPDGLLQTKNPYYYPAGMGSNGSDFTIGAVRLEHGMGNFFKGNIGGVVVFDRALTAEEIKTISQTGNNISNFN